MTKVRHQSITRRRPKHSRSTNREKNVSEIIANDLLGLAKTLKRSSISRLSLVQSHAELQKRNAENRKLGFLGPRHSETLFTFSRALAWALCGGGWLQELELGFSLWERDLKIIAEALSQSTTLKKLSFANSELGNHNLQILGRSLQECAQLEVLNLSACALTDDVAPLLSAILKAHICRRAQADWQASLRSSKGVNALTMRPKGLTALDLSLNNLSDVTTHSLCSVLRIGTPLQALNLRGNRLTRMSGKLLLEVMKEWGILRFVDLRDNIDNKLMGVLEDGQHLTTFSEMHPPFWISSPTKKAHSRRTLEYRSAIRAQKETDPADSRKRLWSQTGTNTYHFRPQTIPLILPTHFPQRSAHWKVGRVHPQASCKNTSRSCNPGILTRQSMQRPSTCPARSDFVEIKQSVSSCSTSPEFAAWEHDDLQTKENRMPFEMQRTLKNNTVDDGMTYQTSKASNIVAGTVPIIKKEKMPLKPLHRFQAGSNSQTVKLAERTPKTKVPRLQTERVYETCENKTKVHPNSLQKGSMNDGITKKPISKSPSAKSGMQPSEWNSFLKEITQAILHLQERLDELIGPDDPNSLARQATSQLQVLC